MKRKLGAIAIIAFLVFFTACSQYPVWFYPFPEEDEANAVSLVVTDSVIVEVNGTVPSTVKAIVTYSDGSAMNCNAMVSGSVDTSSAGEKIATAIYDGVSAEFSIIVFEPENVVDSIEELTSAIASASAGEIVILNGNIAAIAPISISANDIRIIGNGASTITTSANSSVFAISGNNAVIEGIDFETTASSGVTNIITVTGTSAEIRNCTFTGNYDVATNTDVTSRGLELSGSVSDILIENCRFEKVRQPAYINNGTSGTIRNCTVIGTRGWVVEGSTEMTFEGNEFENNAVDIAIIPGSPDTTTNNYDQNECITISKNNNNCYVQNQILKINVNGDSVSNIE